MHLSFKEKESVPKPSAVNAKLTCGGHFWEKDVDGLYLTGVSKLITVSEYPMHIGDLMSDYGENSRNP